MKRSHDGIGLALGGGAGLGWAHIGVLSELSAAGVRIGAASGTSAGALVAACHAFGFMDQLETIARSAGRRRVLSLLDPLPGAGALLRGRRIADLLSTYFGDLRIEDSPIPLSFVCTDLSSGLEVRLTHGPVVPSLMASMAIPGVFPAVVSDGRPLVDGGLVANVPVAAVRALSGVLPVLSVDLMSDYAGHAAGRALSRPGIIGALRSSHLIMFAAMSAMSRRIDPPDASIILPIGHMSSGDFTRAEVLIAAGRLAAAASMPAILAL